MIGIGGCRHCDLEYDVHLFVGFCRGVDATICYPSVSSRMDVIIPLEELMRVVEMGGETVGGRTLDWERMNVSSGSSSSVVVVDSVGMVQAWVVQKTRKLDIFTSFYDVRFVKDLR